MGTQQQKVKFSFLDPFQIHFSSIKSDGPKASCKSFILFNLDFGL